MNRIDITIRDLQDIIRKYPHINNKLAVYFPHNPVQSAAAFLSTHFNRMSVTGQILQALSELDNVNVSQGSYLK